MIRKIDSEEMQNRRRFLSRLVRSGLENEDCIGYHGTSLESFRLILERGYLIGKSDISEEIESLGNVSFYPRKSQFPNHPLERTFPEELEAIEQAESYANSIAASHYFLTSLALQFTSENHEAARSITSSADSMEKNGEFYHEWDDAEEHFNWYLSQGYSRKQLTQTIFQAGKRKGVILGISGKALESYEIADGDELEGDLVIRCKGLPYQMLSGIKLLGRQEKSFFRKLGNSFYT